jgi:diguanylate cyclase (GGDEF)-like protein
MLTRLLRDIPLQRKMATINAVAILSALCVVLATTLMYEYFSFRQRLADEILAEALIAGNNSTAALEFRDGRAAAEILNALQVSADIDHAILFMANGAPLASYSRLRSKYPAVTSLPGDRGASFSASGLTVTQDIVVEGRTVGHIYVKANARRLQTSLLTFTATMMASLLIALFIARRLLQPLNQNITGPLEQLGRLMDEVSETKNFSLRSPHASGDEIGQLARGFNAMLAEIEEHKLALESELARRMEAESHLERLANFDTITQLPNRHSFNDSLGRAVSRSSRSGKTTALLFIDLDNFKMVNDTLGHHVGDLLLQAVALRIRDSLRTGDLVCRIGGDEFAVILENMETPSFASHVAEKLIHALLENFYPEGHELHIGASIGIALYPEHAHEVSTLLRNADTAMYYAKSQGKNHFQIYQPELESRNLKRFALENALRRALEQHELSLHYQPQLDIHENRITGFEALLRWNNPQLGMVSPLDFIPIAEESGLIVPIGEWVLRTACAQARSWLDTYKTEAAISVNLSARQLGKPDIVATILGILAETRLPPHLLDIELTESILMDHTSETLEKLEKIRHAGIRISIDDFGTGYSSMSYLKRYPIDTLKIDRSFISDLPQDIDDAAITDAIIAMGSRLGMDLIAEGVETAEQMQFLHAHGCHKIQGYLIGRPAPAAEIERYLDPSWEMTAAINAAPFVLNARS